MRIQNVFKRFFSPLGGAANASVDSASAFVNHADLCANASVDAASASVNHAKNAVNLYANA